VENLISRGYGAIVIAPADSKALVPVCKTALEKGIVVVNIDNPFHQSTLERNGISIPFVGSSNQEGGALVGEYIRRKLEGKGRVIVIEGIRGVENAELRKSGFIESVTKDNAIRIVASETANWHTDEAFSMVTLLLEKHDRIDAIFCANDKMALGALEALDGLDSKGKVLLAGYDNIEAVRNEMRHGRIHATVEQHPELMGRYGVKLALQGLRGDKTPKHTSTPLDLITYETFDKNVGLSISTLENPFFVTLHGSIEKSSRMHGIQLITMDAKNDNAKQLADLDQLVKSNVHAIIINPTSTQAVSPGIELANAASIPVITVDRKALEGEVACHIASDNYVGGKIAGRYLAAALKGKGRIVELEGIPGTSAAHERGKGFNAVISRYPDIEVVARETAGFHRELAKKTIQAILSRGMKFDAVFAHNDNMILGAMEALEETGTEPRVVLVGFDALPEAVRAVHEGKLKATIAQKPWEMGRVAVSNIARLFRGDPTRRLVPIGLELLTQ